MREVFAQGAAPGRRTGAVMLIDDGGALCGLFTDSDLARLFEQRRDDALDRPIARGDDAAADHGAAGHARWPMPWRSCSGARSASCRWSMRAGRPVGLLDITDLIGLIPKEEAEQLTRVA